MCHVLLPLSYSILTIVLIEFLRRRRRRRRVICIYANKDF